MFRYIPGIGTLYSSWQLFSENRGNKMEEWSISAASRVGVLVLLAVVAVAQDMSKPVLEVYCHIRYIVQSKPYTVQEACGGFVSVVVHGLSSNVTRFPDASFPWTLEASVNDTVKKSVTINILSRASLTSGDDISALIRQSTSTLVVQGSTCANRDAVSEMRLKSTVLAYTTQYFAKGKIRIMCDFSSIDLSLSPSITLDPVPIITMDATKPSLSAAMATGNFAFMINAGTAKDTMLPALVPATAGFFAVIFITSFNASEVLTQQECEQRLASGQKPNIPAIKYGDRLVGTPVLFKTLADLKGLNLMEKAKQMNNPMDLCGDHVLVFMLDPMHTAWNEDKRCNNFLAFKIQASGICGNNPAAATACDVIENPWTAGDGTRFIYRGVNKTVTPNKPEVRMFSFEHGWGMTRRDQSGEWVEMQGYGRLMILKSYLESQFVSSTCDLASQDKMTSAINDIEGVNETADTTTQLPDRLIMAKTVIDRLKTTPADAAAKIYELNTALISLPMLTSSSVADAILSNISKNALLEAKYLAEKIATGNATVLESYGLMITKNACITGAMLERAQYELNAAKVYGERDMQWKTENLLGFAGNLSRILVGMRYFYPNFTCLENVLKGLIKYGTEFAKAKLAMTSPQQEVKLPDAEWLFDKKDVERMKETQGDGQEMQHCFSESTCIQKLRSLCSMEDCVHMEDLAGSKDDVCKMRMLKRYALEHYQALGLIDIRNRLLDDDDCWNNDPMEPRKGPITLWKIRDDPNLGNVIYKGFLNLDNTKVCWKPKATCTCQACGSSPKNLMNSRKK